MPNNKSVRKIAIVGGAGHVGLPLSLVLADNGVDVVVIDINVMAIKEIRNGGYPFLEDGGQELLEKVLKDGNFSLSSNYKYVTNCEAVILTVGTPVDEHLNPDLSTVYTAVEEIQSYLSNGQVLIFRSTLFPGTSEKIHKMIEKMGLDVGVCFCPERISQGHAIREFSEFPQIISGSDQRSLDMAKRIFSSIAPETIELGMTEAELAKLFTNTWRYITFAIANQFYMLAEEKGLDFYRIRDALAKNYPRASDMPMAGFAAGPCLFKDTMQLAAFNRHNFALGHASMIINETLPDFLIEKAKKQMNLNGLKVGILGMAFKPNSDDKRESLAYKLKKLLHYENAEVLCTDPYIKDDDFHSLDDVLNESEIIFIGCPHEEYAGLCINNKTVINCWSPQ